MRSVAHPGNPIVTVPVAELLRRSRYTDALACAPTPIPLLECAAALVNFGWTQAGRASGSGGALPSVIQHALQPASTLTPTLRACARVLLVACLFVRKLQVSEPLAALTYLNPLMEAALRVLVAQTVPDGLARDLLLDVESQLVKARMGRDFEAITAAAKVHGLDKQLACEGYLSLKVLVDWANAAARRRGVGPLRQALDEWGRLDELRTLGNRARHTLSEVSLGRLLAAAARDFGLVPSASSSDIAEVVANRVALLLDAVGYASDLPSPCTVWDMLDQQILAQWP